MRQAAYMGENELPTPVADEGHGSTAASLKAVWLPNGRTGPKGALRLVVKQQYLVLSWPLCRELLGDEPAVRFDVGVLPSEGRLVIRRNPQGQWSLARPAHKPAQHKTGGPALVRRLQRYGFPLGPYRFVGHQDGVWAFQPEPPQPTRSPFEALADGPHLVSSRER